MTVPTYRRRKYSEAAIAAALAVTCIGGTIAAAVVAVEHTPERERAPRADSRPARYTPERARDDARTEAREQARERAEARAEAAQRAERERAEARAEAARRAEREREARAASRAAQRAEAAPSGPPQQIARQLISDESQFQCFSQIVKRESGWNVHAQNPSSGAYGLMQALPGSKMASAGPDWRNNAATQIKWGLAYMKDRYGSPCGAWSFWQANHWY